MTFMEAFGAVFLSFIGIGVIGWYVWCLKEMFITLSHPIEFFSYTYGSHPTLFALASAMGVLVILSQILVWVTN